MKQLFLCSLACILLISCSKKNEDDKEAPVVTITSPTNNQTLPAGEIHIKGTITDNAYINQVHIEISNLNTGVEYLHVHTHPTSKTYAFDQTFTVQQGIAYKIRVIAEDPSTNTSSGQVEVSCN